MLRDNTPKAPSLCINGEETTKKSCCTHNIGKKIELDACLLDISLLADPPLRHDLFVFGIQPRSLQDGLALRSQKYPCQALQTPVYPRHAQSPEDGAGIL